jgi:cell wall assembly regulator SMI1
MLGDRHTDYLREIKTIYNTYLLQLHGEPVGASEEDIQSYEKTIGARLPEAYRQYLLWMGNDPNGVFTGTECFLQDLVRNTEYLPEFLKENGIEFKAEGIPICFYSHQGYQLA